MLEQYLNEYHQLCYPLSAKATSHIMEREIFTSVKEKVPKSQIRERVRMESEAADELWQQVVLMADAHGIAVREDHLIQRNQPVKPDELYRRLWKNSDEQDVLEKMPLWQEYVSYAQKHPMCCYKGILKLVREVGAIREALAAQYAGIEKGEQGEDIVAEYLQLFSGKYLIRSNVLLNSRTSSRAETSEADFCVISNKGVFVCEVKNIGNYKKTIRIAKDGRWEIYHRDTGHSEIKTQSPSAQNAIHCREIECFLEEHGFENVPVIPVINQ